MGGALTLFVVVSLSVFVVRIAAVSMRLTGLDDSSARFQALSAFTGTGFTTRETEMIVNYPIRRRIVSLLMIVGNLGLVSILATLVASFVHTEGQVDAVMQQIAWIMAGMALLWFLMLNKAADRVICRVISRVLDATTELGQRRYRRVLQLGDGLSVCEHPLDGIIDPADLETMGLRAMAVRGHDGRTQLPADTKIDADDGGWLVVYGDDAAHEALAQRCLVQSSSSQPYGDARD